MFTTEQRSGRPSLTYDELLQETERDIRANRRVTKSCDRKIKVEKTVCALGAQNFNGRSQNITDGFGVEVSHAVRTGRR